MPAKTFRFSVVCMRSNVTAEFAVEHETLEGAFKAGTAQLPAMFGDKQLGLRMWRFRFENGRTKEFSAFIGQGETVAEAWADGIKGTRETFRPKNDGRAREQNGLCVLLPARPGDVYAKGRAVSRSVESFQGAETFEEERRRVRLEAERARLAAGGKVA